MSQTDLVAYDFLDTVLYRTVGACHLILTPSVQVCSPIAFVRAVSEQNEYEESMQYCHCYAFQLLILSIQIPQEQEANTVIEKST